MEQIAFLRDLVAVFGVSTLVVFLFRRLRQPTIVGFLASGVLVGPYGLSLISDVAQVELLAEIGVVLLLFRDDVAEAIAAGNEKLGLTPDDEHVRRDLDALAKEGWSIEHDFLNGHGRRIGTVVAIYNCPCTKMALVVNQRMPSSKCMRTAGNCRVSQHRAPLEAGIRRSMNCVSRPQEPIKCLNGSFMGLSMRCAFTSAR